MSLDDRKMDTCSLDDLRKEIDGIDTQLVSLLTKRMETVEAVAAYKQSKGIAVLQADREKTLLDRIASLTPPSYQNDVLSLYRYMLDLSRQRQHEVTHIKNKTENPVSALLRGVRAEKPAPRVTVQGIDGSFASAAARGMYPDGTLHYVDSWADVLTAIGNGDCDYGVLPVENSLAGSVNEVFDLLIQYNYFIVKAMPLTVEQCVLGVKGSKLTDIRKVYSHPVALCQCSDFLRNHRDMQSFPCENTAVAAEFVAREGNLEYAAIASKECAQLYGLDILSESIQQSDNNETRFISVSRTPEISDHANKISVVFTLPHVTGSLYRTLMRFAMSGLNLTKIESRPNASQNNFEYYFYLDFNGSMREQNTLALITALHEELPSFRFLGNYFEP